MAENAALKSRVADLERELEEALCKHKLGSVPGGAKVVTLALRSGVEGKKDLVSQLPHIFSRRSNWILHRKCKYYICCLRDIILKIEISLKQHI